MEISGVPEPLLAAAIVAALAVLEEEAASAAAVPAGRPVPGRWVAAGLARSVPPPFVARPAPATEVWVDDDPGL
jgi:hypothetical protein